MSEENELSETEHELKDDASGSSSTPDAVYKQKADRFRMLVAYYAMFAAVATAITPGVTINEDLASLAPLLVGATIIVAVASFAGGYLLSKRKLLGFWLVVGTQLIQLIRFSAGSNGFELLAPFGIFLDVSSSARIGITTSYSPGITLAGDPSVQLFIGINLVAAFIVGRLLFEKVWWDYDSN